MKQFIYATCFWFIIAFVVFGLYNNRYDYKGNITIENNNHIGAGGWQTIVHESEIKGLDFEGNYVIIHYENGYHRAISNVDISWRE